MFNETRVDFLNPGKDMHSKIQEHLESQVIWTKDKSPKTCYSQNAKIIDQIKLKTARWKCQFVFKLSYIQTTPDFPVL